MNTISKNFTQNYTSTPSKTQAEPAQATPPEASQPEDKSSILRVGVESLGAYTAGAWNAAFFGPVGAATGVEEALAERKASESNRRDSAAYGLMFFGESLAVGGSVGFALGGPVGAAVGATGGALASLVGRQVLRYDGDEYRFLDKVQTSVDKAIADNTSGSPTKRLVQNMSEGALVGTYQGVQEGWNIGKDIGKKHQETWETMLCSTVSP